MTSRYFGLRQFGQLYGYLFGLFLVGTGAGPALMGAVHTRLHSYDMAFLAFGVMLAIAGCVMLFLGPYRYPVQQEGSVLKEGEPPLSDAVVR
jgi:MFS family permease